MEEENEKKLYASYNVLARKALVLGVPIVTLVVLCISIMLSSILGIAYFGDIRAAILPILLACFLFFVRVISLDDSRAMEGYLWDIKGLLTRFVCRSTVTSFTAVDDSLIKRKETINEFFKTHNIK